MHFWSSVFPALSFLLLVVQLVHTKTKMNLMKKILKNLFNVIKKKNIFQMTTFTFGLHWEEMVLLVYTVFSTGKKKYRCWGCFSHVDKATEMRSIPQNIYCILRQLLRGEKIAVATLTYSQWYSAIGFLIEPSGVVHHHWSCLS